MKRSISLIIALMLLLSFVLPTQAAGGKVTYHGQANGFVFAPGTDYSLTDLFPNFKSVMPGDSLTQTITVKNDAAKNIKVKIYLRSLGADAESADFLSKLHLTVKTSEKNKMAYMFDAAADQTAGLTDWVYLGTLYSGGTVNIDVTLDVPVELGNEYSDRIGYIDWEFMVEEFETDPTDPFPPQTGDDGFWWIVVCAACAVIVIFFIFRRKREKEEEKVNFAQ